MRRVGEDRIPRTDSARVRKAKRCRSSHSREINLASIRANVGVGFGVGKALIIKNTLLKHWFVVIIRIHHGPPSLPVLFPLRITARSSNNSPLTHRSPALDVGAGDRSFSVRALVILRARWSKLYRTSASARSLGDHDARRGRGKRNFHETGSAHAREPVHARGSVTRILSSWRTPR